MSGPKEALISKEGGVLIPTSQIPFSSFASREACETFVRELGAPPAVATDIAGLRRHYDAQNDRLLAQMREQYCVTVEERTVGGVPVHSVRGARASANARAPILISLHGGGFLWGGGSGALIEAIPIAAIQGVEVLCVDYRMAPEHVFPAASEDVTAVYAELLNDFAPAQIGIYGCSAGAVLTAQSIAWIIDHGLPPPGAAALLFGAGVDTEGESIYTSPLLCGTNWGEVPIIEGSPKLSSMPYFYSTPTDDPMVQPILSAELLRQFPPTLLVTASRDFLASGISTFHRRMVSAGVDARLFMFDGLWHAFHIYPNLPESEEVYSLVAAHFKNNIC